MIAYPDTSFLYAFYLQQSHSPKATEYAAKMKEPLHLTELVRYEFRQSVRFQVWRKATNDIEGLSERDAQAAIGQLEDDLKTGVAVIIPCSYMQVLALADKLSERFTIKNGHRSLDVLHVATALALKAKKLLSFDRRQRKLAESAGLQAAPL